VDVALTGVVVPAGTRQVHLAFRPLSFRIGAALSLVSLAAAAYALFFARSKRLEVNE
jgi:uncharacterized membrane protein YfhO